LSNFIWTQSAVKDLEKEETCPSRWKGLWLDKLWKTKASEAADYGNYFEYLCIGANAKGEAIKDLPRLVNGNKSTTQKRIELQAARYKDFTDPLSKSFLGYETIDTQVHLKGFINGVETEGTADMLMSRDGIPVIADLKLTEDLDNVRTKYGWGNPTKDIDLIQQVLYGKLYEQMTGIVPERILLVFEHGPKMRAKLIKLSVTGDKISEMEFRITTANGWTHDPSEKECGACQISSCLKRYKPQQDLIIETINY
jgi:hypothetical protein